jgi:predicted ester cyclase
MTLDENKAIVRRFIEEVFVGGSRAALDELLADGFVGHTWGTGDSGRAELEGAMVRVAAGLSGTTMTIEDMIAEGDRVAVRLTAHAVQTGPFMRLPPSGRDYTIGEIHWFRIDGGRIVEHWHQADLLGMMRQLGALPG